MRSLKGLGGLRPPKMTMKLRQSPRVCVGSNALDGWMGVVMALALVWALAGARQVQGEAPTRGRTRHVVPATSAARQSAVLARAEARPAKRKSGVAGGRASHSATPSRVRPHETRSHETRSAGRKRRGRKPEMEPADDPILMYRAEHGAKRGGLPTEPAAVAHGRMPGARHGGRGVSDVQPAERAYTRAEWAARVGRTSAEGNGKAAVAKAVLAAPRTRRLPGQEDAAVASEPNLAMHGKAAGSAVVVKDEAAVTPYAEGVARPEGEDAEVHLPVRVLQTNEKGGDMEASGGNGAVTTPGALPGGRLAAPMVTAAPVVRAGAAAPSSGGGVQPQVVQGFGGEIAVVGGGSSGRPGGTRRRSHPAGEPGLPAPAVPATLEEREAITEAAVSPAVLPTLYDRDGRLVMPAPLKGSRFVLVHQNQMANSDGLERVQNDADLERLRAAHQLVGFETGPGLRVSEDLPMSRRCARPWTVLFAEDLGSAFYARFRQAVQVNSAVRTVAYQARLQTVNGNAAATAGEAASPHLTGQAIDIGKRGMNAAQLAWMRAYLLPVMQAGKIDVEEEFHQACFHISIYRSYAAGRRTTRELAEVKANVSDPGAAPAGTVPVAATEAPGESQPETLP